MTKEQRHRVISYWKSGIRLLGYVLLPFSIPAGAIVLFVSEVLGVAEEVFGS